MKSHVLTGASISLALCFAALVCRAGDSALPEGDYDAPVTLQTATFIGSARNSLPADPMNVAVSNVTGAS